MSDGPHKSLPLRKAWKDLAKRADQSAFSPSEVRDSLPYALASDWRSEVSAPLLTALRDIFSGSTNPLGFIEIALADIHAAAPLAAGSVFGASVIGWALEFAGAGKLEPSDFFQVVGHAAIERGAAGFRQIEEHYHREVGPQRAAGIRGRLSDALASLSPRALGESLIQMQSGPSRGPKKATGLDEGVSL